MNRIAIIGTGHMGAPIARALWKAGHKVAVINRTAAKAEALAYECPGMAYITTLQAHAPEPTS